MYPVIVMAAHFGLRRSEIAGLRWRAINLKEQYFWIEHTISKVNYAVAKDKAKNKSSHRRMPFGDDTLEMLIALKDTEDENRKLYTVRMIMFSSGLMADLSLSIIYLSIFLRY